MRSVALASIRRCLDGAIPSGIATCDAEGTPNVAFISQVRYLDPQHIAISYQFFNKTRKNILHNFRATLDVADPQTAERYHLTIQYLRTETEGPLFEAMKAHLAGIASHTGMGNVFKLLGADVFRVLNVVQVEGPKLARIEVSRPGFACLNQLIRDMDACEDLTAVCEKLLAGLNRLGYPTSQILVMDEQARKLFTLASLGYPRCGAGAEIPVGFGVAGVAAQAQTVIRINHMAQEYIYSEAVQRSFAQTHFPNLETTITPPLLDQVASQLAVPIVHRGLVLAVLLVESETDFAFSYDDEDLLSVLGQWLALKMVLLDEGLSQEKSEEVGDLCAPLITLEKPILVQYFERNDSVFLDHDYVIKGVAGCILWRLLEEFDQNQRCEFTNRELRLDPTLRLPELSTNLEARLILLQNRLAEKDFPIKLIKAGRGKLRLCVDRPLRLVKEEESQT